MIVAFHVDATGGIVLVRGTEADDSLESHTGLAPWGGALDKPRFSEVYNHLRTSTGLIMFS